MAVFVKAGNTNYAAAMAYFGTDSPSIAAQPLRSVPLVAVEGEAGSAADISVDLAGSVALIDRGGCTFTAKAIAAQEKGAIAVVIANNQPDDPFAPRDTNGAGVASVSIPVMMVSQSDGAELRSATGGSVDIAVCKPGK